MGSENHVVVDVSSDEEDIDRDYLNWLNKDKSNSTDVVEDDDDDCVLLDCDPDKTSAAVEAEADDDDDEVLVVGQKGEVLSSNPPQFSSKAKVFV